MEPIFLLISMEWRPCHPSPTSCPHGFSSMDELSEKALPLTPGLTICIHSSSLFSFPVTTP